MRQDFHTSERARCAIIGHSRNKCKTKLRAAGSPADAAEAYERDATPPPAVDNPSICNGTRGGDYLAAEHLNFIDSYREQMREIEKPASANEAK